MTGFPQPLGHLAPSQDCTNSWAGGPGSQNRLRLHLSFPSLCSSGGLAALLSLQTGLG